jgi:hypothetical protein
LWATTQATRGTGITVVATPVFLRVGRVMLSSVVSEEGLGIFISSTTTGAARENMSLLFFIFAVAATQRCGIFAVGKIVKG